MIRAVLAVLSLLTASVAPLAAQDITRAAFRAEFEQGMEFNDEKMLDKTMKKSPAEAVIWFEELYTEQSRGKDELRPKVDALRGSWERSFGNKGTIEKLERWINGMDSRLQQ